jgi:large subunit ribosomal protein L19
MNLLQKFDQEQMDKVNTGRGSAFPPFRAGDELEVCFKIRDGQKEKTETFKGLCIARRNRGFGSSLTMRKISSASEGVEKVFPLYSPNLLSILVLKCGDVRRAKLYYLRERSGKSARIKESKNRKAADANAIAINSRVISA